MKPESKNLPATADASAPTGASTSAAAAEAPATFNVAYHDGPPAINFFGVRWERGKAQTVTAGQWAAMQARPDCAPFEFRVV